MSGSGILKQTLDIKKTKKKCATHFAIYKKKELRYLISLQSGKGYLYNSISTYSHKLSLIMKILQYMPYDFLKIGKIGCFVQAKPHFILEEEMQKMQIKEWNLLVGTYDEKQKVVFQCLEHGDDNLIYIKVGNFNTRKEMKTEIQFLENHTLYQNFSVPKMLGSRYIDDECPFTIQITKGFKGDKVEPLLVQSLVKIYQEVAKQKKVIDGKEYEFSHGDFAPWNIKKHGPDYIVYDWEHCGFRTPKYDLVYYCTVVFHMLYREKLPTALEHALNEVSEYVDCSSFDKKEFLLEYQKIHLQK